VHKAKSARPQAARFSLCYTQNAHAVHAFVAILNAMKLFNGDFFKFFFGFLTVVSVTLLLIIIIGSQA